MDDEKPQPRRRGPGTLAQRVAARRAVLANAIERFVAVAQRHADVRAVYVFGSFARGDLRPHSDLDLLVVRDTTVRRAERDLDLRLAFDAPVGIDLIVVTPGELEHRLPTTGFGRTILSEATRVYAR